MPKAFVTGGTGFVGANCPGAKTWQGYRCETQICQKRFNDRYLWKPSPEIEIAIQKAIFG